jgi:hypothetical protein
VSKLRIGSRFALLRAIMNVGPPPFLSANRPQEQSGFARRASKACLAAPLIIIGLSTSIYGFSPNHRGPSGRGVFLILGAATAALFLIGALCGILAMALAKPAERRSVILRTLCGFALLGLLVAIAVPNFIRARELALRNKQSLRQLSTAVADVRAQAVVALTNGGKTTVDPEPLLQSFNQVEKNSSGDTALLFQCTQRFIKREMSYQQTYAQAASDLTAAKVVMVANLERRSQISGRKAVVQKFLDANDALKTFILQSELNLRKELTDAGVSAQQTEGALKGFRKTWQPQAQLLMSIRDADDRFGHQLLEVLDLFDGQWGQWRYDTSANVVRFEDGNALRKYKALMAEIKQTSGDQAAAQQRLAALLSQPNSMF